MTKSNSLKGIEMIVGDSIIMPSDISAEATSRSMTRKGRKMRQPIGMAVLSSMVTKEGSRIETGTAFGLAELRDLSRVAALLTMGVRSGEGTVGTEGESMR